MKDALRIVAFLVALSSQFGCMADPIRRAESNNPSTTVDVVTEFEGVRLYRVNVGDRFIYVAVSLKDLRAEWEVQEGKTTVHRETLTVKP